MYYAGEVRTLLLVYFLAYLLKIGDKIFRGGGVFVKRRVDGFICYFLKSLVLANIFIMTGVLI